MPTLAIRPSKFPGGGLGVFNIGEQIYRHQCVTQFPLSSDLDHIDYVLTSYGGHPLKESENAYECGAMINDGGFYHWQHMLDMLPDNVYDVARFMDGMCTLCGKSSKVQS